MLTVGPMIAEAENDTLVPQIVFKAAGVILELGAGIGNQIPRFDPSKVAKIYGVEPVTALHNQLRSSIKKAKLDDVYTVVPCGIENTTELQKYGIEPKSIDTIISISVLCSVPQPEEVAHQLYSLLKPGGKLVFYEHVRSPDFFSRQLQRKPKGAIDLSEKLERLILKVQVSIISFGRTQWVTAISTAKQRSTSWTPGSGWKSICGVLM